jgi:hypothetical protein
LEPVVSDLIERLRHRASTMNGAAPAGASDGCGTYAVGYYGPIDSKLDRESADRIASLEAALAEARERYVAFRQILVETLDTSSPTEGAMEFMSRLTDRMEQEADKFDAAALSSSKQKDGGE